MYTLGSQPQVKADVVMKIENTVRLVGEGTTKASRQFCIGETVPVYRYYGRFGQSRGIGTVKIVKILDDKYLEAVVTVGNIKDGDVAKKGSATC
jgi:hypothetical protein